LVEELDPASGRHRPPGPKTRTIAAQVAHSTTAASDTSSAQRPASRSRRAGPPRVTRAQAVRALGAKRKAVLAIVGAALKDDGKIVGFHHDAAGYLMYYMLHDAHTRGQIVLAGAAAGISDQAETMIGCGVPKRAKE